MQANSPSAFFLSLTLHGLVVALLFFFTVVLHKQKPDTPKVFELVAGEGDNYAATEAPAYGAPDVVRFNVPDVPAPVIRPDPPRPTPEPEPEPVVTKAPETPKAAPVKTESPKAKPVEKPKPAEKPKPQEPVIKRMTKEEYDRRYGTQKNPAAKPPPAPKVRSIDSAGIRTGVLGGSTNNKTGGAGGKALTREQQDLLESYIALLLQRLRAAHQKPPGLSDLLHTRVQFRIAADGTLSAVKVIRSSGSPDFDRSVLEAFARVRSIGPTPDGKSDVWEVTFRMREEG